ncbi:P-loop NTPase fold protein [Flavisolibacter nicotianae]|uniref:P-loop NTPase fold protein n=1 Tax=Flavisolibacter nicotianae TaxID=2364882 RepID=UPI000EAEC628|nr:P-loop NTPase fold protein [Flavisolibacter nicotianae]
MTTLRIDHTEIGKEFLRHLDLADNKRILFSGPFGTGKSTFLREVLGPNERYLVLSVNPINYSIGTNQDVFEWIKYDILLDLIYKHASELDLTQDDFSTLLLSQMYLVEKGGNVLSLISPLIALSEKVGKPIATVLTALRDTVKDFQSFRKRLEQDEGELITQYFQRLESSPGSPYEKDPLSKLIGTLLERLKHGRNTEENQITTVLVVDALDRLDPEHIFRLFNVFSAHYDIYDTNKFGFDKVVFVCDVENIRKIFHHRYGTEVDFNGYIDKFYSREVFDFNNRALVKSFVQQLIQALPLSNGDYDQTRDFIRKSEFYNVLKWVLYGFIQAREINLRMLVQIRHIPIATERFPLKTVPDWQTADSYPVLSLFKFLRMLFPSVEILERKLERVASLFSDGFIASPEHFRFAESIDSAVANYCLPFLLPEKNAFDQNHMYENTSQTQRHTLPNNFLVEYRYERDRSSFRVTFEKFVSGQDRGRLVPINNFQLLYETFKVCREKGIVF